MMKTLKKIYNGLNRISDIVCKVLVCLAVVLVVLNFFTVLLQILNRHVIVVFTNKSLTWTEELSRYSMIWLCYIALPLCLREGSMAQLDLIFDRVGKKERLVLFIITRILMLITLYIAIFYGYKVIIARKVFKSSIMRLPGWALYSAPVVGSVLLAFETITELIGVLSGELESFSAGKKRLFEWKKSEEDSR